MKALLPTENSVYELVVLAFLSSVLLFENQSIIYPIVLIGFALSNIVLSDSTKFAIPKFAIQYSRSTREQSPENELKIKVKLENMYVTVNSFWATFTFFHVLNLKINPFFKIRSNNFFSNFSGHFCSLVILTSLITIVSIIVEAFVKAIHSVIREHI